MLALLPFSRRKPHEHVCVSVADHIDEILVRGRHWF